MAYTERQTVGEGIPAAPSKPMFRNGLWAPNEDEKLINYIKKNGNLGSWSYVAKQAGLHRCGKSCRLRWINYLRPGLKRGPFSYREERLIIRLQSIFGNRWSLIAAHLPGRTDNDLKNYWNSCISKKLKLKHHLSSSSTNNKSDILSKSITNSVSVHANNPFTLSHSSQQCFDVIPEGFQPPNNSFNVVTTEQNSLCVQGVLELKHGQLQDESDLEFSIDPDPTKIRQISYPNQWINASSINTGESFSSPADFISRSLHTKSSTCDQLLIESYRTTLTPHDLPSFADFSLVESESSKEKVGNDENHIMIDDSNAWSATHPYSNATDCSQVVVPGVYSSYEAEISILENENTTHQSCPPLDLRSQFSCPASQFSEIHPENDCTHRLNLSYDVNMGVPTYMGISSRFERNELPGIEEAIKENQITTLGEGIGNGPFQTGADQNKAWPHDNMYNINPASPSDLDHIYFT